MSMLLKIRSIGVSKHKSSKFAVLSLYFSSRNNIRKLVYTLLQCEIHLVKGLRANLLIDNDIISPKAMIIDLRKKTALIGACEVTINVNAK